MRIGFDLREAHHTHPTGKSLWTKNVLRELISRNVDLELFEGKGGLLWHIHTAKRVRKQALCDLYLSPTSFIVPALLGNSFPHAIVVHDLIAFDREPHDTKATIIERWTLPKALRTAKYIFTVSNATKKELLHQFPHTDPKKVTIAYEGPTTHAAMEQWNNGTMQKNSILCVGTLCPRKNQLRLIQAFNKLPEDVRLTHTLTLVGGRGWHDEGIVKLAKHSKNVEWRGYVGDDELTELYATAKILALPSLKEGFGLPVLDAMMMGLPVLTSNRSSLPEVAGDSAILVDPESVESISEGLNKLLTNENIRADLSRRGKEQAQVFTWANTATAILNAIQK
jgi:glycosyltransferase involved in cell wall biosynthesis